MCRRRELCPSVLQPSFSEPPCCQVIDPAFEAFRGNIAEAGTGLSQRLIIALCPSPKARARIAESRPAAASDLKATPISHAAQSPTNRLNPKSSTPPNPEVQRRDFRFLGSFDFVLLPQVAALALRCEERVAVQRLAARAARPHFNIYAPRFSVVDCFTALRV